jgi:hypothetical protein
MGQRSIKEAAVVAATYPPSFASTLVPFSLHHRAKRGGADEGVAVVVLSEGYGGAESRSGLRSRTSSTRRPLRSWSGLRRRCGELLYTALSGPNRGAAQTVSNAAFGWAAAHAHPACTLSSDQQRTTRPVSFLLRFRMSFISRFTSTE